MKKMSVKALKKQLMAAIAMVLVAAISLSSATYAWFVNNTQVTATGAQVQAATAYSLLISNDNKNFGTTAAFDTALTSLVPVSTAGTLETTARTEISSSDKTATEAFDLLFAKSNAWEQNHVTSFTEVGKNSVVSGSAKYYYTDTIYLKPGQDGSIYLDSSSLGIVWNAWDTTAHKESTTSKFYTFAEFAALSATDSDAADDAAKALAAYKEKLEQAQALLSTLRVGFVVTYPDSSKTNSPETLVGTYIYQLTNKTLTGGSNTTAKSSSEVTDGADGVSGAVSVSADDHKISVSASNLTTATNVKTATSSGIPVISGIAGQASALATAKNTDLAIVKDAKTNVVYTVDTYIWMEGCDVDTVAGTLSQFGKGSITGLQFGFCLGEVTSST
jgi:hypothetical protein